MRTAAGTGPGVRTQRFGQRVRTGRPREQRRPKSTSAPAESVRPVPPSVALQLPSYHRRIGALRHKHGASDRASSLVVAPFLGLSRLRTLPPCLVRCRNVTRIAGGEVDECGEFVTKYCWRQQQGRSASRRWPTGREAGNRPSSGRMAGDAWWGRMTAGAGSGASVARPSDGRPLPLNLLVEDGLGSWLGRGLPVRDGSDRQCVPGRRSARGGDSERPGRLADR